MIAGVAGFFIFRTYREVRGNSQPTDRIILTVVRISVLVLLVFCLFRPVLVLSSVVPQENFLGVLIDDSRSMQIADTDETPRQAFVTSTFGDVESETLTALSDRFALRFFSFSSDTKRVNDVEDLTYEGTETHLGQALARAQERVDSETGSANLERAMASLRRARVRVNLGRRRRDRR